MRLGNSPPRFYPFQLQSYIILLYLQYTYYIYKDISWNRTFFWTRFLYISSEAEKCSNSDCILHLKFEIVFSPRPFFWGGGIILPRNANNSRTYRYYLRIRCAFHTCVCISQRIYRKFDVDLNDWPAKPFSFSDNNNGSTTI